MPPCTEEIHLPEQQVTLFVCSYERFDLLDTHVTFTDAVPGVFPERASVTVQPALAVSPPVTVVSKIHLVVHVCIALRIVNSVVTEVPCGTIVDLLLIGNQVVDFLNISLEVAEVLEGLILCHDRLGIFVEPVGAGCHEEGGKRKEEGDYSTADISHSTFHFPLSTKYIYHCNHNY